jgi:hypothetical protein
MSVFAWVAVVLLSVSFLLTAALIGAVRICLELTLEQQTGSSAPEYQEHGGRS